jgi:hypothetical protein
VFIEIVKSGLQSYWYSDKIGNVYEVEKFSDDNYKLIHHFGKYVSVYDCRPLKNGDITKSTTNKQSIKLPKKCSESDHKLIKRFFKSANFCHICGRQLHTFE